MGSGKRYDNEPKLNMKKVAGVILGIAVVIMFIITLVKLLNDSHHMSQVSNESKTTYYSAYENGKWGIINQQGEIVIEPKYDEMLVVPDKTTPVFISTYDVNYDTKEYKTKAINEKEEPLFLQYNGVEAFENEDTSGNLFYVKDVLKVKNSENKCGLINSKGKEILKCNYDDITPLKGEEGVLLIQKEQHYGLVDNYGNVLIKPNYQAIKRFGSGSKNKYIVVNQDGKYGILSSDDSTILDFQYDEIKPIDGNNLYAVKENGEWKVISKDLSTEVADHFDDILDINNEAIIVEKDGKLKVIDTNQEEKIPAKYDSIQYAYGDNYIVKQKNQYGIVNLEQETKVECKYKKIRYIQEAGLFIADVDDVNSDILDKDFQVRTSGILSELNLTKGYMKIRQDDNYHYYNFKLEEKKNTELLTPNTLFLDKKDGKYGYINNRGEVIVDYIYDDATEQNEEGYASVNQNGKWGSIDATGKVVAEPQYDLTYYTTIDFIGQWHISADTHFYSK